MKAAFVVALAVIVAIFVLQNSAVTSVRFLAWTYGGIPLAAVVLLSLAVGIVLVGVPLWLTVWQCRARVRRLEKQVAELADRPVEPKSSSTNP
jgi:uncharacterized integral membrane protein